MINEAHLFTIKVIITITIIYMIELMKHIFIDQSFQFNLLINPCLHYKDICSSVYLKYSNYYYFKAKVKQKKKYFIFSHLLMINI